MNGLPLLTAIIFLPLLGAVVVLAGSGRPGFCRAVSLLTTLADLALAVVLLFPAMQNPTGPWLRVEDHAWIPSVGIRYTLALDGLSLMLILLTLFWACFAFSCRGNRSNRRPAVIISFFS